MQKQYRGLKRLSTFRNSSAGIRGPKKGRFHEQVPVDSDGAYRVSRRIDGRDILRECKEG